MASYVFESMSEESKVENLTKTSIGFLGSYWSTMNKRGNGIIKNFQHSMP